MRVIGTVGLLLVSAVCAVAQEQRAASFMVRYDLDSTNFTYCVVTGTSGDAYGSSMSQQYLIKTTGSSTSVTENTASTNPFVNVSAGDVIVVRRPDTTVDVRVVVSKADNANVTVDSAVDWSGGFTFSYRKTTCGTAVTNGWVNVAGYTQKSFTIEYNQGDLTGGLDWRIECQSAALDSQPVIVYPGKNDTCGAGTLAAPNCNFATASVGIVNRLTITNRDVWSRCRIGVKVSSSDASDAGANLEQIGGYVVVSK